MSSRLPRVSVATLGGTITMTSAVPGAGVVPTANAHDLLAAVPGLDALSDLHLETLLKKPGASLDVTDILLVLDWANARIADGSAGVVVVQGTDTLEDVAYLLDLLWAHDEPLVLTGAMRDRAQLSPDGPSNLHAAVAAAAYPGCRGLGVIVVMNNEIHAARRVTKGDTCSLGAFSSGPFGMLGRLHEGRVTVANRPARLAPLVRPSTADAVVAVIESALGDRGDTLRLALQNSAVSGVVLAGFGAGHLHEDAARAIDASLVPVVLASRTGRGPLLETTYGFPGSERDLIARGAIPAGWLTARQARLLLLLFISNAATVDDLHSTFAAHGGTP
ncbi:MAG TPA: asparaginase [Pedococcus sp.]|nr:asparaginase [Pedococcus sp.]